MRTKPLLLLVALIAAGACEVHRLPTAHMPDVEKPGAELNYEEIQYPLHVYGDETDGWDYLTAGTPLWVEIPADDQTPTSEDGYGKRRVCPNDHMMMRNAHLRMNYGLETLDLDFRGPFSFIRHVSTLTPAEGGAPIRQPPIASTRTHTAGTTSTMRPLEARFCWRATATTSSTIF